MYGAATYLGYQAAQEGLNIARDPYKRAKIKKCVKAIKDTIKEKLES